MEHRVPLGSVNDEELVKIGGWLKSNVGKRAWDGKLNNRTSWDVRGAGYRTFIFYREHDALLFALTWIK